MFSQLPKFFDRDFLIGYFLPVTLFFSSLVGYLCFFVKDPSIPLVIKEYPIASIFVLVIVFWFSGLLLLSINRLLIRVLEGYYYFPWKNALKKHHERRFQELQDFLSDWKKKDQSDDQNLKKEADEKKDEAIEKAEILSQRYPNSSDWILPTKFGNTIRAFEVYSNVMYGFDSILGWSRILAIMPTEFRVIINEAKSQVDFWINLIVLSLIFGIIVFGLSIFYVYWQGIEFSYSFLTSFFIIATIIFVIFFCYHCAIEASIEWGELVKTAFDVYLPKLANSLELELPNSRTAEREFWKKFSRAIGYRYPEILPDRKIDN